MDSSWEWLRACHSAVCCQGESAVLLGSMCPPVPSQAWWCPVEHPWPGPRGLEDANMARGATWGPWPPPHAHGLAQQQCPSAQAGPSKGLGQPMTPKKPQTLITHQGTRSSHTNCFIVSRLLQWFAKYVMLPSKFALKRSSLIKRFMGWSERSVFPWMISWNGPISPSAEDKGTPAVHVPLSQPKHPNAQHAADSNPALKRRP